MLFSEYPSDEDLTDSLSLNPLENLQVTQTTKPIAPRIKLLDRQIKIAQTVFSRQPRRKSSKYTSRRSSPHRNMSDKENTGSDSSNTPTINCKKCHKEDCTCEEFCDAAGPPEALAQKTVVPHMLSPPPVAIDPFPQVSTTPVSNVVSGINDLKAILKYEFKCVAAQLQSLKQIVSETSYFVTELSTRIDAMDDKLVCLDTVVAPQVTALTNEVSDIRASVKLVEVGTLDIKTTIKTLEANQSVIINKLGEFGTDEEAESEEADDTPGPSTGKPQSKPSSVQSTPANFSIENSAIIKGYPVIPEQLAWDLTQARSPEKLDDVLYLNTGLRFPDPDDYYNILHNLSFRTFLFKLSSLIRSGKKQQPQKEVSEPVKTSGFVYPSRVTQPGKISKISKTTFLSLMD